MKAGVLSFVLGSEDGHIQLYVPDMRSHQLGFKQESCQHHEPMTTLNPPHNDPNPTLWQQSRAVSTL